MIGLSRINMLLVLCSISVSVSAQCRFTKVNQTDSSGLKHGYWVIRSKASPDQKIFSGWYKHGNETKRCTYYDSGNPALKLRYLNDSVMRIRKYNTKGKLQYKGRALWLKNEKEMRYCWDGEFTFYDPKRHKIKEVTYIRGVEQDQE
jgi:antitoxin component YwqK of YwqJK toxin-antitoxin module